ncbi:MULTISPECIES: hypothetical protein [Vibrio]|uniref:hypothetical protein n=1 Tax=Vibrio TaxID=662 RepID=UPI0015F3FB11|nr:MULTISPECIES: hypothetical protein [Vibrio]ELI1594445.1 hypothetical protein [Vibrio alginolyticus]GHZ77940.1 hypothetical protein VCSRO176_1708 [Vibrio cholerae]EJE4173480.1 hypothetical protein [Vibrio parahaemolyticus]MCC9653249.1 hypothetical protein [Vibrio sp. MA64]HCH1604379.1 hypothetical protein [Vibrio parahaemolyticus]
MARPKSYTDQDLIKIVQEILSQGDEVSTWRIKEQLGRGKLSTIKRDLERLIDSGEIDTTRKEQNTAATENPVIASYELPIEVQNLLAQSEQEICKIIQRITTSLNCQVHQHYENLMNARIHEFDTKTDLAIKAQAMAENTCAEMEVRLLKQIELNESLEEKIEHIDELLMESRHQQSDLIKTNNQLTNSLKHTTEKLDSHQETINDLKASLAKIEKGFAAQAVQLDYSRNEAKSYELKLSEQIECHEQTVQKMNEVLAELKSTQSALEKSDVFLQKLQSEHQELSVSNKVLEANLRQSQEMIANLNSNNQILEQQLSLCIEERDSFNELVNETALSEQ